MKLKKRLQYRVYGDGVLVAAFADPLVACTFADGIVSDTYWRSFDKANVYKVTKGEKRKVHSATYATKEKTTTMVGPAETLGTPDNLDYIKPATSE